MIYSRSYDPYITYKHLLKANLPLIVTKTQNAMLKKGRPKKIRYIQNLPRIVQFSPRGKPGRPDEIELSVEQFEAIKLADFQNYNQFEAAVSMRLSRASFGRILRQARRLLADAIVNGKIIKIRMGDAQIGVKKSDFTEQKLAEEIAKFKQTADNLLGQNKTEETSNNKPRISAQDTSEQSAEKSPNKT